jgi:hypothetical protein
MQFKIKILEKNSEIEQKILRALLPKVNSVLTKYVNTIGPKIKEVVSVAIKNSPEYNSILNGTLKYELGIPDGDTRINNILNIWLSNMTVAFKPVVIKNSQLNGSVIISLIKADLSDVLGSDAAFITDNKTGSMVDWLNWLSLAGDRTIIKDYNFILGANPRSRTGGGIMRYSPGTGKWKIPSQFSGTITNNWITRAIDSASDNIDNILSNNLKDIT